MSKLKEEITSVIDELQAQINTCQNEIVILNRKLRSVEMLIKAESELSSLNNSPVAVKKKSKDRSENYPVSGVHITADTFITELKKLRKPDATSVKRRWNQLSSDSDKRKDFLKQLELLGHVQVFTDNGVSYYFPAEFDKLKNYELSILKYFGLPCDTPASIKAGNWTVAIEPGNRWTAKRFNGLQEKEVIKSGKGFLSFFADVAFPGKNYYDILKRYQDNIENKLHGKFEPIAKDKGGSIINIHERRESEITK